MVGGVLPLRRCGGTSAPRARSDLGQASSNVAGGASAGSGTGGGTGGAGAAVGGAVGPAARAWARSRSFRDVEENNRLRRGFGPGSAASGAGVASTRTREAVSSRHGGGEPF